MNTKGTHYIFPHGNLIGTKVEVGEEILKSIFFSPKGLCSVIWHATLIINYKSIFMLPMKKCTSDFYIIRRKQNETFFLCIYFSKKDMKQV